ncbi:MAG TPA: sensor domain-containing phosphodiesterase [Burkholderiaceae bacterium]|nr:sensor domain-containing phosphodiesterase [Burkholderiaceae bacterium]
MDEIPLPFDESARLSVLRELCLLDTPADRGFDLITDLASHLFRVPIAVVSLVDENRQWFKSNVGLDASETPRSQAFCAHAIMQSEVMVVGDATRDPRFERNPLVVGAPHIRFYAGAPLEYAGRRIGTLCIIDRHAREQFSEEERLTLAKLAAMVVARIEALNTIGYVDPITRLPNRSRFLEDVESTMTGSAGGQAVALAIDPCGPQFYGDLVRALGWSVADNFLRAVRTRLEEVGLPQMYSLGSHYLACIVDTARGSAADAVDAITRAFDQPIGLQGAGNQTQVAIGSMPIRSDFTPKDVLRSILTAADVARRDHRPHAVFAKTDDSSQVRAFQILSSIGKAVENGDQFHLCYQPKIDVSSGACIGAEALLRWTHPSLGNVSPGEFIALAERTRSIGGITRWVLHEAMTQAARWRDNAQPFAISVNLSALDVADAGVSDLISRLLDQHDLQPEILEIEITESSLLPDLPVLEANMRRLADRGVVFSIDDFGAGYSNLSYLSRIPARTLKIDQSFIRPLADEHADLRVVPSIVRMGHEMGFRVLAEGVEVQRILDLCRTFGVDEAQGYLIARPMRAPVFESWMRKRRWNHGPDAGATVGADVPRRAHPASPDI